MNPIDDFIVLGIMLSVVSVGIASVVMFKLILPHAMRYKQSVKYFTGFFVCLSFAFISFIFTDSDYAAGKERYENVTALFFNIAFYISGVLCLRYGFLVRKQQEVKPMWQSSVFYTHILISCVVQYVMCRYFLDNHDIRIGLFNVQLFVIIVSILPFVSADNRGERLIRYTIYIMTASLITMSVTLFFEQTIQYYHIAVMTTQILNFHVWMGMLFILLLADSIQHHYENSLTDELTGLNNRRFFMTRLNDIQNSATEANYASLILCDIDYFKRVNDTYGHEVGDHVIRQFAQMLDSQTRSDDFSARIGGEEFAVCLPNTRLATAEKIAECMRVMIESLVIHTRDGRVVNITASFGVASLPGKASASELSNAADKAMYQAKKAGRNRVQSAILTEGVAEEADSAVV